VINWQIVEPGPAYSVWRINMFYAQKQQHSLMHSQTRWAKKMTQLVFVRTSSNLHQMC